MCMYVYTCIHTHIYAWFSEYVRAFTASSQIHCKQKSANFDLFGATMGIQDCKGKVAFLSSPHRFPANFRAFLECFLMGLESPNCHSDISQEQETGFTWVHPYLLDSGSWLKTWR